jgi:hypothetical protein
VVVLYLSLFQCEVAGVALAGEVVAVGMAAAASIRAGGRHLVPEEAVVAGDSAPARCRDRAEVVGRFAVSGEVVVPRAIGAAFRSSNSSWASASSVAFSLFQETLLPAPPLNLESGLVARLVL